MLYVFSKQQEFTLELTETTYVHGMIVLKMVTDISAKKMATSKVILSRIISYPIQNARGKGPPNKERKLILSNQPPRETKFSQKMNEYR